MALLLENPEPFRPLEAISRSLPLPRYGALDPTRFTEVLLPMFVGLLLGDAGFGLALALVAAVLHRRSRPGTASCALAVVVGACALFSIAFGVAMGEFLGALGERWLGVEPLLMGRERRVIDFLAFVVALGAVYVAPAIVLAAVLGPRTMRSSSLRAVLCALAMVLMVPALATVLHWLPQPHFRLPGILILISFPILLLLEGVVPAEERFAKLRRVLTYGRVVAIGTASVMLAILAGRRAGPAGSMIVGAVFALLFHLANVTLVILEPAIHQLRSSWAQTSGPQGSHPHDVS